MNKYKMRIMEMNKPNFPFLNNSAIYIFVPTRKCSFISVIAATHLNTNKKIKEKHNNW